MLCLRSCRLPFVVLAVALAVAGSFPALAQTPGGRVIGVVRDARGVAREAATITATNIATRAVRSTTTAVDGGYALSNLTPGTYTVTASLIGFRRAVRTDVQIVGETTIDFVN